MNLTLKPCRLKTNQQIQRRFHCRSKHSLFKHLETALLANSIDFPPKRISGLSSTDEKQSIIEIGCHCCDANCLRCHLFPCRNRENVCLLLFHLLCADKQRRGTKTESEKTHVMKFVRPGYHTITWVLISFHHTCPHPAWYRNYIFRSRSTLTASALRNENTWGNAKFTTWIIRHINQVPLAIMTVYLSVSAFVSRCLGITDGSSIPWKIRQHCLLMPSVLHLGHDGCWVTFFLRQK